MPTPLPRSRSSRRVVGLSLVAGLILAGAGGCSQSDAPSAGDGTTTVPVATTEPVPTTEVPLEEGTQLFVYNPEVGHCFDRRSTVDGSARNLILLLDCDKPHMYEVFALVDIPDEEYPGEANLDLLAKRECPRQWTEYVGNPYETSRLELSHHAPSRADWNLTLQHSLACLIRSPGQAKLEDSKRDSGE